MHLTAERLDRIQPSLTIAIATKARHMIAEGKNVISLSQGEPDFETPRNIKDAAIRAIEAGETQVHRRRGHTGAAPRGGGEVQARQRHRLQAGGDHHLDRRQAGDLQRHAGDAEQGRRGHHPQPVLGELPGHRLAGRRQAGAGALRAEPWLQAACRGAGAGDHAAYQMVHAEQPVQSDGGRLLGRGAAADLRCAAASSGCVDLHRRHLRKARL